MRIPLSSPDITEAEIEAVSAVLRTNTLSLGPQLIEFEQALAAYHQTPHAIAVSSGTAALHLALLALFIGPGDEVIVPSFTFIAVANAVRYVGATPVFADIDPLLMNIDPASVEAAITAQTRAIIIVHTFGIPAEMEALMQLANQHRLAVIEDACEAIGATYNNQRVGTFGDISVFAFYPNKQMTTGEGGAILTRNPALAERMRALRNQGRYPGGDWLQHQELGYNYRLSEMSCALGLSQLTRLESILRARSNVARMYSQALASIPELILPPTELPDRTISWFVYTLRLSQRFDQASRDRILQALQHQGIGCARYFAPIHRQPAYANISSAQQPRLPLTENIAQRTLALPFFNRITQDQITEVAQALQHTISELN
jgi:perosamine synthetase